jgi:hypothetical protein
MTTAPQHPSVRDRAVAPHEGLTVPELLAVLDGEPPVRPPAHRRTPAVVAGARTVAAGVRRTAPPAAAAVSAAAASAAATAGSFTARHVRRAWRTYEAWPRRVEPDRAEARRAEHRRVQPPPARRRPGTGPGRLR